jgi:hypothetical protein
MMSTWEVEKVLENIRNAQASLNTIAHSMDMEPAYAKQQLASAQKELFLARERIQANLYPPVEVINAP